MIAYSVDTYSSDECGSYPVKFFLRKESAEQFRDHLIEVTKTWKEIQRKTWDDFKHLPIEERFNDPEFKKRIDENMKLEIPPGDTYEVNEIEIEE
jgi:hypothetical protein